MKDYVALKVHCPLSHREEIVYVYYLKHGTDYIRAFNGCETGSTTHECCTTVCKNTALKLFDTCVPGEPQVRPHIPAPQTDDPAE